MRRYVAPTVTRQEVHYVPEARILDITVCPYRVWTLYGDDPNVVPELPFTPAHNVNAFLEDKLHDWQWVNGKLRYYSRVALNNVWILCEFAD